MQTHQVMQPRFTGPLGVCGSQVVGAVILSAAYVHTFLHCADLSGIINAQLLSWLRPCSALINGGRGKHVVEGDLLAALDEGQVRAELCQTACVVKAMSACCGQVLQGWDVHLSACWLMSVSRYALRTCARLWLRGAA